MTNTKVVSSLAQDSGDKLSVKHLLYVAASVITGAISYDGYVTFKDSLQKTDVDLTPIANAAKDNLDKGVSTTVDTFVHTSTAVHDTWASILAWAGISGKAILLLGTMYYCIELFDKESSARKLTQWVIGSLLLAIGDLADKVGLKETTGKLGVYLQEKGVELQDFATTPKQ